MHFNEVIDAACRMKPTPQKTRSRTSSICFSLLVLGGGALTAEWFTPSTSPPLLDYLVQPGCKVKGNISYNEGKRIYHLPGMEDYETTVIDPRRGEKWFCSETDAQNSGWSKAPN